MHTSDKEGEGLWPVRGHDLTPFHCEVVEGVRQLLLLARLVLEPDELPVLLQDEVPLPPVLDVFASLEQFPLLHNSCIDSSSSTTSDSQPSFSHLSL